MRLRNALVLGAVLVLAVVLLAPQRLDPQSKLDTCAQALSAECLADLGVDAGLRGAPPARHSRAFPALFALGRLDDAYALMVRRERMLGHDAAFAERQADGDLAAPRLAQAIRAGRTPVEAYASVPAARYGNAWIVALELLGQAPYGLAFAIRAPTETERGAAKGLAQLLVDLAEGLSPAQREHALDYAAELYAMLGDLDRAAEVFQENERGDRWSGLVPHRLTTPAILQIALERCGARAGCRANVVSRAAPSAMPPTEADALLREAFAHYRDQDPWPDFDAMAQVVNLAAERGDGPLALALSAALDAEAQTRAGVFPSFPHIAAARALLTAGAPTFEVRAALERAEAEMPQSGRAVVALGHLGPITWGGGIGSEARWTLAHLWARIGAVDRALRLMDGIDQPAYGWAQVIGPELPPAVLDPLVAAAEGVLAADEVLHFRAQAALQIVQGVATEAQRSWAVATTRAVLGQVDPGAAQSVLTCRALAHVGRRTGELGLERAGLECMAGAALHSGDAEALLLAAGVWHDLRPHDDGPAASGDEAGP